MASRTSAISIIFFFTSSISSIDAFNLVPDYFASWIVVGIVSSIGVFSLTMTIIACYFDCRHWKSSINTSQQELYPEYDEAGFLAIDEALERKRGSIESIESEEPQGKGETEKWGSKELSKESVETKEAVKKHKTSPTQTLRKFISIQSTQPSELIVVPGLEHVATSVKAPSHGLAQSTAVEKQFKILQAIYQSSHREMPPKLIESIKHKTAALAKGNAAGSTAVSGKSHKDKLGQGVGVGILTKIDEESTQAMTDTSQRSKSVSLAKKPKQFKSDSKKFEEKSTLEVNVDPEPSNRTVAKTEPITSTKTTLSTSAPKDPLSTLPTQKSTPSSAAVQPPATTSALSATQRSTISAITKAKSPADSDARSTSQASLSQPTASVNDQLKKAKESKEHKEHKDDPKKDTK